MKNDQSTRRTMIHKFARFQVKREKLPEAAACIATFVDEVGRKEGGTAKYEAFQDAADPTRFTHYMVFRTPAAEKYHQTTPWVKAFVAKLYPLCVEEPVFTEVSPVPAKP